MEFVNGKKNNDLGDGDIIMLDREPWVIDDPDLIDAIKKHRAAGEPFDYNGQRVTIVQYYKGETLSKTLVRVD